MAILNKGNEKERNKKLRESLFKIRLYIKLIENERRRLLVEAVDLAFYWLRS
jgi:hypothetical protein